MNMSALPRTTAESVSPNAEASPVPQGQLRDALRLALRLVEIVETRKQPAEMTQALSQAGRCYRVLGAWGPAIAYTEQALAWSRLLAGVDMSVDLMCELADLHCAKGETAEDAEPGHTASETFELARDLAFQAAHLATQASDPGWEVKVLMRVSDTLDRCGDHEDAISFQTRALGLMTSEATGFGDLMPHGSPELHDLQPDPLRLPAATSLN